MELRRRMMSGGGGIPYQQIEYLANDKNTVKYIDTQYVPTVNTKVAVEFAIIARNTFGYFGVREGNLRFCSVGFSGSMKFAFAMTNNTWPDVKFDADLNTKFVCIAENGKYSCNGSEYTTPILSAFNVTKPFVLIGTYNATNQVVYSNNKVYSCKIWESNVLQMDLIPVRIGTTGYMYDKVSGELFGNAGTGDFILGPDIN